MSLMKPVGRRSCLLLAVNGGKYEPSRRRKRRRSRSPGSRIRLQQADKHGEKEGEVDVAEAGRRWVINLFVRQQSSQTQLMASPGRGGRSNRRPKCEEEMLMVHKDQRRLIFIAVLEKKYTTRTFDG